MAERKKILKVHFGLFCSRFIIKLICRGTTGLSNEPEQSLIGAQKAEVQA
jgi:hypothetical protein